MIFLRFQVAKDPREQVDDVLCALPKLRLVEDDVVVVEVKDHGDVEFLAQGEELVYRPAYVVVLEDEALLDVGGESGIIFSEPVQSCFTITKDAAEVENHHCIAVLLRGHLQEAEKLGMVFEVANRIVDDLLSRRAKLGVLTRMSSQAMSQLGSDATGLCQFLRHERQELISVFLVACEWEHFTAET